MLLVFIEKPNRHGNLCSIEQLRRHSDNTIHQISLYQFTPNLALTATLARQRAVGQHNARTSRRGKVVDDMLNPRKVGIAIGRCTVFPTHIIRQLIRPPIAQIERRIGHHEIGLQSRMAIIEKGIRIISPEIGLDTANRQVHLRHFPCRRIGILTINRYIIDISRVTLDELCRLYKHTTRTAARIVNTTFIRL